MGQYFLIMNLDKEEYLHPHKMGCGLKLWEICTNNQIGVLPFLLRKSSSSGGGDYYGVEDSEYCGRWAGDRIAVIGDYDESGLFNVAREEWDDITKKAAAEYNPWIQI